MLGSSKGKPGWRIGVMAARSSHPRSLYALAAYRANGRITDIGVRARIGIFLDVADVMGLKEHLIGTGSDLAVPDECVPLSAGSVTSG